MNRFILLLCILLIAAMPCLAQTVTFAWDPHDQAADLTGFRLYQSKSSGTGYSAVATFTPGSQTTGSITRPGLGRYYYVLTAYTPEVESDYSNEVTLVVKPKPPKLISVVQTALMAPIKGIGWLLAKVTGKDKGLKILKS